MSPGATCAATESIRFLDQDGYLLAKRVTRLNWGKAGDWCGL